jgi:hypothetical protein
MPPIRFTDAQLDVIMAAAEPLAVADRDPFLRDVAERLRGHQIGDGLIHRVIAEVQRKYFAPPLLEKAAGYQPSPPSDTADMARSSLSSSSFSDPSPCAARSWSIR